MMYADDYDNLKDDLIKKGNLNEKQEIYQERII